MKARTGVIRFRVNTAERTEIEEGVQSLLETEQIKASTHNREPCVRDVLLFLIRQHNRSRTEAS